MLRCRGIATAEGPKDHGLEPRSLKGRRHHALRQSREEREDEYIGIKVKVKPQVALLEVIPHQHLRMIVNVNTRMSETGIIGGVKSLELI